MGTSLRVMWSEVPSVRAPQGYFLRAPALGNSRCVPALGNSRRSLHFVPLCTHTEHLLLAVFTFLAEAALLNVECGKWNLELLFAVAKPQRNIPLHFVPLCTRTEHSLLAVVTY